MGNINEKTAQEIIAEGALVKPVFCFQCKHFIQSAKHKEHKMGKCNLYDCIKREVGYCDKGDVKKD